MNLTVNGESKAIDTPSEISNLDFVIDALGFNPKLVVVEFNGKILTPELWGKQAVKDNDILEIVTIVGGG